MSSPDSAATIAVANFTQFKLESHVEKSLQRAWLTTGGHPLDAGELLTGALLVRREARSKAFDKLAELLPVSVTGQLGTSVKLAPANLAALPLRSGLAESFSVAQPFFRDMGVVWGRDYVTLAFLAKNDPSVDAIAMQAGSDRRSVIGEWYKFVTAPSSGKRRSLAAWQQWWRAAGVPLPVTASTVTKQAFLLTWNPSQYRFGELEARIKEVETQGYTVFPWGVGNRRSIPQGARVFLMRQGEDPRGIMGVGEFHGDIKEEKGKRASVDVRWVALSRDPFLALSELSAQTGEVQTWAARASGTELGSAVAKKLEELWATKWGEHTRSLHATPTHEARCLIARFNADRGAEDDSLNVTRYIQSFARVMASRTLAPPLSIGLFGDWGSGKTFFMERLFEEVEALKGSHQDPPLYWERICQIRFNAWHYAETNLWASLVSTIFNELRTYCDGPGEKGDEFNKLLNQLELAAALRNEAEEKVKEAVGKHEAALKRVEEANQRFRELPAVQELSDAKVRELLSKTLKPELLDPNAIARFLESAAKWTGREEFSEGARRLRSGQATVEEAKVLLQEANALYSRAGFWWRVLSAAKLYKTWQFWVVLSVLIGIPIMATVITTNIDSALQKELVHLWALIGEIVTAAGAAIGWGRAHLSRAAAVFDRLSTFEGKLAARIEEASTKDRKEYEARRAQALTEEKLAKENLEAARRDEQQATEEERLASEALQNSTSRARLGRFIRERASGADYEKHLGLIAMIHRDFGELSKLMVEAQKEKTTTSSHGSDSNYKPPRIDRIILYIDDLDRCYPPETVVKVLEAVHLLCFFELFVVVVGVDSRWLSRSLHRHYQGMLSDEAIKDENEAPAGSQDFLEKIFQVPFWLRRMEPEAVQSLVHSLVSSDELELNAAAQSTEAKGNAGTAEAEAQPGAYGGQGQVQANANGGVEEPRIVTVEEDRANAEAKRTKDEAEMPSSVTGEPLATPAQSLTITEHELTFMDKVCPLMPRTPRAVKRFINIYRLYKAALSPLGLSNFLGTPERPGNYRGVQVLLALVTGSPQLAQEVFGELREYKSGSDKKLSDLSSSIGAGKAWETTAEALKRFAQQQDCNLPLQALKDVSRLVARYSLHNMVIQAPGE